MKKEQWLALAEERRKRFTEIAKALGPEHPVTKMMGTLAWGRNTWESGPRDTTQEIIQEAAFLAGCFHILNMWVRDHDTEAQDTMMKIWLGKGKADGQ